MKKLLISSLILTSIVAFAYTQVDVDNANYLANKNIITQQSTATGYRLDDTITRAELVWTALKLKWITLPENYQCKKYFSDVVSNDWICRAVELAADNGLISRENSQFNPNNSITRAEALSITIRAGIPADKIPADLSNYINPDFIFVPSFGSPNEKYPHIISLSRYNKMLSYVNNLKEKDSLADTKRVILVELWEWQFGVIRQWLYLGIIDGGDFWETTYFMHTFRENTPITRAAAFKFMKNTYNKRELMSGEVSI